MLVRKVSNGSSAPVVSIIGRGFMRLTGRAGSPVAGLLDVARSSLTRSWRNATSGEATQQRRISGLVYWWRQSRMRASVRFKYGWSMRAFSTFDMLAIKSGADLFDANRCARQVNNEFDQADCPELSRPGPFSVCSGISVFRDGRATLTRGVAERSDLVHQTRAVGIGQPSSL